MGGLSISTWVLGGGSTLFGMVALTSIGLNPLAALFLVVGAVFYRAGGRHV
jgi:hypothetical protein